MVGMRVLALAAFFLTAVVSSSRPPPCDSSIYCHGPLLHTIQMAGIYVDSKTFVDMKIKNSVNETIDSFNALMNRTESKPTVEELLEFLAECFESAGSEFETYDPRDWKVSPHFLDSISDRALKLWASDLNGLWKFLGRKMKEDVRVNPELYSIIYVPNPVIVPGGRFREFYYWDSYWIIRGLLLSEMTETVKGMLENFLSIVDRYGHIPNGGRLYYLMRSQVPLLIPMVDSYIESTNDVAFLEKYLDTLEKEFEFWLNNRTVTILKDGKNYTLAHYSDNSDGPRPESYREDITSGNAFKSEQEKNQFYSEMKAAAESGWDFSTRWFILNGTNQGNLTNIKATAIIPVELNSIICWNAEILSKYNRQLNRLEKAEKYSGIAKEWMEAIHKLLWHEEVGAWLDYDNFNQIKRDYFYPTNIAPLWTKSYDPEMKNYYVSNVLEYLKKMKVMVNQGGIPATFSHSGEQWDYPNAWPPLQYIVVMALDFTGDDYAKDLAYSIAERWVRSNFKAYNDTHAMFEKYDATIVGGHGGGGEYEVQLGFGWSNAIIVELLHKYGDRLTASEVFATEELVNSASSMSTSSHFGPLFTILLAQTSLAAGCIGAILYARRRNPRPDKSKYVRIPGTLF